MNLSQITLKGAAGDPASGARPLALSPGKEVVARVLMTPEGGGHGLISLAGIVLEARLPPGLDAGRTLRLQVVRADQEEVVVKIVADAPEHLDSAAAGRVAGELALRGDPDLLRTALVLAGGTLWLPGGAAASVAVDPDADGARAGAVTPPLRSTARSWGRSRCGCTSAPAASAPASSRRRARRPIWPSRASRSSSRR